MTEPSGRDRFGSWWYGVSCWWTGVMETAAWVAPVIVTGLIALCCVGGVLYGAFKLGQVTP